MIYGKEKSCTTAKNQNLPADLEDKITNFHKHIIGLRKEYNYPLNQIGNMDETPCFFLTC